MCLFFLLTYLALADRLSNIHFPIWKMGWNINLFERDHLIHSYFHQGLSYTELAFTLLRIHGVSLCVRQLKRILAHLGLKRRFNDNNSSPLETIVDRGNSKRN